MSDIEAKITAAKLEYIRELHSMQAGVAQSISNHAQGEPSEVTKKHLRVGVNAAMSDIGSLSRLLIKKGLFTELEYVEALRDGMKLEKERYEQELTEKHGVKITLGSIY